MPLPHGPDPVPEKFAACSVRLGADPEPFRVLDPDGHVVGPLPELDDATLLALYRWMAFGRALDGRALAIQRQGRLTVWAPATGQEAALAGMGLAMESGDWVFTAYREPLLLLMRGLALEDLLQYFRGLYWVANPYDTGAWPIQIVIADQTLHAVGAGLGFRLQGQPHVAVASVGDGATSQGDFYEAINFGGVFGAQALIYIQNNGWAISTPRARQSASQTLAQKALAFGLPGLLVDGNDPLAVYQVARHALDRARAGEGPIIVEALTYRLGAHTTADDPTRYQPPDEIAAWRGRDPIIRFRRFLERRGLWDAGREAVLQAEVLVEIDGAIARAEARPTPSFDRVIESTWAIPPPRLRAYQAARHAIDREETP